MIKSEDLKDIVEKAIEEFNTKHKYLLENDLSERCICSSFARCIEDRIPKATEYNDVVVDVEYNRGATGCERAIKRMNDEIIIPDLIVHKRGYDNHYGFFNLICVEMKKSTDRRGSDSDKIRLRKLVGYDYGFNYRSGFMIIADMKDHLLKIESEYYLSH